MKDHIEKYDFSAAISPIEEIVEEARNGRMYILVDAEDRENEGDLIIPAQFATPAQVNFMAKHGRGLICLAVTRDRAKLLELDMMARENRESMKTAFTVSIEAKEGVKIPRPPGPMKHGGSVIAFIEDPDGYKIELIERK